MKLSAIGWVGLGVLIAAACSDGMTDASGAATGRISADGIVSAYGQSQTRIVAGVGNEVQVNLGTVGPGSFDSLPAVSSASLRFLDAAIVPPYVPAGPRQRFRFTAAGAGRAIVAFQFSGGFGGTRYQVVDTIDVH